MTNWQGGNIMNITMTQDEFEKKVEEARHSGYELANLEHRRGEKTAYDLGYKHGYTKGYNTAAQGNSPDLKFFGRK